MKLHNITFNLRLAHRNRIHFVHNNYLRYWVSSLIMLWAIMQTFSLTACSNVFLPSVFSKWNIIQQRSHWVIDSYRQEHFHFLTLKNSIVAKVVHLRWLFFWKLKFWDIWLDPSSWDASRHFRIHPSVSGSHINKSEWVSPTCSHKNPRHYDSHMNWHALDLEQVFSSSCFLHFTTMIQFALFCPSVLCTCWEILRWNFCVFGAYSWVVLYYENLLKLYLCVLLFITLF